MVNIFEIAVQRLIDLGFYDFLLPFVLFTAVMYAVLHKTKMLGESLSVQAVISVSAGLLVFGLPVILGTTFTQALTAFVTQSVIIILVIAVAFIISSFFYPNISEKLTEIFKPPGPAGTWVWIMVAFAAAFGLFKLSGNVIKGWFATSKASGDLLGLTITIIIAFIILLIVSINARNTGRGGG